MQFSVQQLGVGNPFLKTLPLLIPQSNNPAKILPQDKFKDKYNDLLDAKFLRWKAFCSRVEIVALTNVGVYCCQLSQGVGKGRM